MNIVNYVVTFVSNAVPCNLWYAIFAGRCSTPILWMVPGQIPIFGLYAVPKISMKVWLKFSNVVQIGISLCLRFSENINLLWHLPRADSPIMMDG